MEKIDNSSNKKTYGAEKFVTVSDGLLHPDDVTCLARYVFDPLNFIKKHFFIDSTN